MIDDTNTQRRIEHCLNSARYNMTCSKNENYQILQEMIYHFFDTETNPIDSIQLGKATNRIFVFNEKKEQIITFPLPIDLLNRITNSFIDKDLNNYDTKNYR